MNNTVAPSKFDILFALKDCCKYKDLQRGKRLHVAVLESGLDSNIYLASTLIHLYARCGRIQEARKVFDRMQYHDVVSWNALILGYAYNGKGYLALELFLQMNCIPDFLTFVAVLKACTDVAACEGMNMQKLVKMGSLEKGMAIHSRAVEQNCDTNMRLSNVLVDMYTKCGSIVDAQYVFDRMDDHDVVSWSSLILGYADKGEGGKALKQFSLMLHEGCVPNSMTFLAALKACSSLDSNEETKQPCGLKKLIDLHSLFLENCWETNIYVANTLVDMYAKCGSIEKAREAFNAIKHRDIVSWNVLILGYADNGQGEMALTMFSEMEREGFVPNDLTFVAALKACTSLVTRERKPEELERGMAIHLQARRNRCDLNMYVASTLVDFYAKCGCLEKARQVFESMPQRDVVSWNALVMGYADNGEGFVAMELFIRMRREGCVPNTLAFVSALKACAIIGALEQGRALHKDIKARGFDNDMVVATSLVDFYAKCSSIDDARRVFDAIKEKSSVAWGAIIAGYSRHGDTDKVFELFRKMEDDRVKPTVITFTSVLTACNHAGHLEKGKEYFETMVSKYGIRPSIEHYTCLIDLFGRANKLDEAVKLMNNMPFPPDSVSWMAILGSCTKWKNVELGKRAFEALLTLDPENASIYVLMEDIYISKGMCQEQSQIEALKMAHVKS